MRTNIWIAWFAITILVLGEAIRCFQCIWSNEDPPHPEDEEMCKLDQFSPNPIPESLLVNCPTYKPSCVLWHWRDNKTETTYVERGCSFIQPESDDCAPEHTDSEIGECFCGVDLCNGIYFPFVAPDW